MHFIFTTRKVFSLAILTLAVLCFGFEIDSLCIFNLILLESIKTVLYLNLRIGRESMNHQVLSGDMLNDATPASRFRNDDPAAISQDSIDYRHVPLVDNNDDDRPNTSVV